MVKEIKCPPNRVSILERVASIEVYSMDPFR